MPKHLRAWHTAQYNEYLKAAVVQTKSKKETLAMMKGMEDEMEREAEELEIKGTKKPKKATLEHFWGKAGPIKYGNNSDFQRRAELEMAIYIATSNLSFKHIESDSYRR